MKETILCASIQFGEIIISGHRHSDCYEVLQKLRPDLKDNELPKREHQGFLTNVGRHVSREQAWVIAKESNQILYGLNCVNETNKQLISENLY